MITRPAENRFKPNAGVYLFFTQCIWYYIGMNMYSSTAINRQKLYENNHHEK